VETGATPSTCYILPRRAASTATSVFVPKANGSWPTVRSRRRANSSARTFSSRSRISTKRLTPPHEFPARTSAPSKYRGDAGRGPADGLVSATGGDIARRGRAKNCSMCQLRGAPFDCVVGAWFGRSRPSGSRARDPKPRRRKYGPARPCYWEVGHSTRLLTTCHLCQLPEVVRSWRSFSCLTFQTKSKGGSRE
jgi:hypothetical protein